MLSKWLLFLIGDLIAAKDGSISLTRLAACTAHALAAAAFVHYAWSGVFDGTLWALYLGFGTGHAVIDKTSAMVKDVKEKQNAVSADK